MTVKKRLIDDLDLEQPKARLWKSEMALARMAFSENKLSDASRLVHKAMEMSSELKERDFARGVCQLGLAIIADASGNKKDAEREFERALSAGRSDKTPQHSALLGVALRHYGNFAFDQGNREKARKLLEESMQILQEADVEAGFHLALTLCDLAGLYIVMGEHTRAQSILPTAIEILQNVVETPDDMDYSRATFLFEAAMTKPDEDEFLSRWKDSATRMQYQTGLKHPFFIRVLNRLAKSAQDAGRQDLIEMMGQVFSKRKS